MAPRGDRFQAKLRWNAQRAFDEVLDRHAKPPPPPPPPNPADVRNPRRLATPGPHTDPEEVARIAADNQAMLELLSAARPLYLQPRPRSPGPPQPQPVRVPRRQSGRGPIMDPAEMARIQVANAELLGQIGAVQAAYLPPPTPEPRQPDGTLEGPALPQPPPERPWSPTPRRLSAGPLTSEEEMRRIAAANLDLIERLSAVQPAYLPPPREPPGETPREPRTAAEQAVRARRAPLMDAAERKRIEEENVRIARARRAARAVTDYGQQPPARPDDEADAPSPGDDPAWRPGSARPGSARPGSAGPGPARPRPASATVRVDDPRRSAVPGPIRDAAEAARIAAANLLLMERLAAARATYLPQRDRDGDGGGGGPSDGDGGGRRGSPGGGDGPGGPGSGPSGDAGPRPASPSPREMQDARVRNYTQIAEANMQMIERLHNAPVRVYQMPPRMQRQWGEPPLASPSRSGSRPASAPPRANRPPAGGPGGPGGSGWPGGPASGSAAGPRGAARGSGPRPATAGAAGPDSGPPRAAGRGGPAGPGRRRPQSAVAARQALVAERARLHEERLSRIHEENMRMLERLQRVRPQYMDARAWWQR